MQYLWARLRNTAGICFVSQQLGFVLGALPPEDVECQAVSNTYLFCSDVWCRGLPLPHFTRSPISHLPSPSPIPSPHCSSVNACHVSYVAFLQEPQCKVCKQTPVIRCSKHLFLDLPKVWTSLIGHLFFVLFNVSICFFTYFICFVYNVAFHHVI